jgi:hypothetical protein
MHRVLAGGSQPPPPLPTAYGMPNPSHGSSTNPHPVSAKHFDKPDAREDSLSMSMRSSAPKLREARDFPIYRCRFTNHFRAIGPIYPRVLEGLPPPDAHVNTHYQSFHHRVLALLNMAMEDHPYVAIALTNFGQDSHFATRHSPISDARRALNSLLDQRGVSRTIRLLLKRLQPQLVNERLYTYL